MIVQCRLRHEEDALTTHYLGHIPQNFPNAARTMRHDLVPEGQPTNDPYAILVTQIDYDWLIARIEAAEQRYTSGDESVAWFLLTVVAERKGRLLAALEARYEASTEKALRAGLRERGQKGGRKKGTNYEACQNATLDEMLKSKPQGGWRTIPDLYDTIKAAAEPIYEKHHLTLSEDQLDALAPRRWPRPRSRSWHRLPATARADRAPRARRLPRMEGW